MSGESADRSVRPGLESDAPAFGRIQVRAWRETHAAALGEEALAALEASAFTRVWAATLAEPPREDHMVLAACEGPTVVGFAAVHPSPDPDAAEGDLELAALEVDPGHRRGGHASRLLSAVADLVGPGGPGTGDGGAGGEREVSGEGGPVGAATLRTWVLDGDGGREEFLASAGFAADGAARTFEVSPGREATERRWSATLG